MPFSFVHASDLQLGAPLFGIADLPDELRTCMIDARYSAARRVFDVALAEQADALILAGGVIADSAGPRAMWFFTEQCLRLAEAGIPVYWSEARSDSQGWRQYIPLPDNVFLADSDVGQVYECTREDGPTALILSGRAPHGAVRAVSGTVRIAVIPGAADLTRPENPGVDYWALGGRSQPGAVRVQCGMAQFSGTTQGESPEEHGPRGCLLVCAEERRRLSSQFVPTAGVQWHDECVSIVENTDWADIRSEMIERLRGISRSATGAAAMVRWTLRGHGIVWRQLLREDVTAQLLDEVRGEFEPESRPVWSLFVEPVADETQLAQWRQEESEVGDLVRAIRDEDAAAMSTANQRIPLRSPAAVSVDSPHVTAEVPHYQKQLRERAVRHAAAPRHSALDSPAR